MAEDIVVVNGLLAEQAGRDLGVDDCGRSCCVRAERPSLEAARDFAVHLDGRLGCDDLQVNVGTTRATLPNTYVVNSIDQKVFVDRVETGTTTFAPPPNIQPFPGISGRWVSTVRCPPAGPPCNVVVSPAIVPGEHTVILYTGWAHGTSEPDGVYVFRYTIHGTLNGVPIDLTASSPKITMTR